MGEQTIAVSDARATQRAETGRHAWVRSRAGRAVYCQPMPTSPSKEPERGWWGRLRNISSAGVAVCLSRPFEPGTLLIIELSLQEKRRACRFPGRVVHATPEGARFWIVGCEFLRLLSDEELEALVGE